MLVPGTSSVYEFSDLPDSGHSTLPGDVWQVPNIKAYFSDKYREYVTGFYFIDYKQRNPFPFDPVNLNHPPEFAYTYIKDQTRSTYLEEYTYPLRDSVFVNGMEPFYESGEVRFEGATQHDYDGDYYDTKVILRYYPSSLPVRLAVWLGIIVSVASLYIVGRKVVYEN